MKHSLPFKWSIVLFTFLWSVIIVGNVSAVTIGTGATTPAGAWNVGTRTYTVSGTDNISSTELATNLAAGNVSINVQAGSNLTINGITANNNSTVRTLTINVLGGNATVSGNIDLSGSNGTPGANTAASAGGAGHNLSITVSGTFTSTANISTAGGTGAQPSGNGQDGGAGGAGGNLTISATAAVNISGTLSSAGGQGGLPRGNNGGGAGGAGGNLSVASTAGTLIITQTVTASGGNSPDGNNSACGAPGVPGNINISGNDNVTLGGAITANAGNAGACTQCGDTKAGANNTKTISIISAAGTVTINGIVTANGGNGAKQSNSNAGTAGGTAGTISINGANGINISANITAKGGTAGDTNGCTATGGSGGAGGTINLTSTSTTSQISVDGVLNASGGDGGTKGSCGGNKGGKGGAGGAFTVNTACDVKVTKNIIATGGNGGSTGTDVGVGGNGGSIKFINVGKINEKETLATVTFSATVSAAVGTGAAGGTQSNNGNYGTASNGVNITFNPAACSPPLDPVTLSVSDQTCNSYTLSWNTVAEADKYILYSCTSSAALSCTNEVYSGPALSKAFTGLPSGTTTYYMVKAVKTAGGRESKSTVTAAATTSKSIPVLTAVPDYTSVSLSWTTPSGTLAANPYELYRCTSQGGGCTSIYTGSALSYTDGGRPEGVQYYYRLQTTFTDGCKSVVDVPAKTLLNIDWPTDPFTGGTCSSACPADFSTSPPKNLVGYMNFAYTGVGTPNTWSLNNVEKYGAATEELILSGNPVYINGNVTSNANYTIVKNPRDVSANYIDVQTNGLLLFKSNGDPTITYKISGLYDRYVNSEDNKAKYCIRVKLRNVGYHNAAPNCSNNGNNANISIRRPDSGNNYSDTPVSNGQWRVTNSNGCGSHSGTWDGKNQYGDQLTQVGDYLILEGTFLIGTGRNELEYRQETGFQIQIRPPGHNDYTYGLESIEVYGCLPKEITAEDEKGISADKVFCEGVQVTLKAVGTGFGDDIKWYKSATAPILGVTPTVGSGTSITVPAPWGVGSTEKYWAMGDFGSESVEIKSKFCCSAISGVNVVLKEDFSQFNQFIYCDGNRYASMEGKTTATGEPLTQYPHARHNTSPACRIGDGYYGIVKNANLGYDGWGSLVSRTPNKGMLLVNAAADPNYFYQMDLEGVCSGTTYELSMWYANVTPTDQQGIGIILEVWEVGPGGVLVNPPVASAGPFDDGTPRNREWHEAILNFNTPSGGPMPTYRLRMRNHNGGGPIPGNDFVIDEIMVTRCVPTIFTVEPGSEASLITVCSEGDVVLEAFSPNSQQWDLIAGAGNDVYIQWMETDIPNATDDQWTVVGVPTTSKTVIVNPTTAGAPYTKYYRAKISGDSDRAANIGTLVSSTCVATDIYTQIFTLYQVGGLEIETDGVTVCAGKSVEFTGTTNGDYFAWRNSSDTIGIVWNNIATYTPITSAELSDDGNKYYFYVKKASCFSFKEVTLTVDDCGGLDLEKTVNKTTVCQGDTVIFSLELTNIGSNVANTVEVTDLLPSGFTYISHTPGSYTSATGKWVIGTLAAAANTTLNITAKATGNGNITNQAYVSKVNSDVYANYAVAEVKDEAAVAINQKPTVTSDLAFSAFCEGDAFTATTTPTASNEVTKGFEIETAVSSGSYTSPLPSTLSISDSGKRIRYFATNGCGTVYSNLVTLTVNPKPTVTSDLAFSAFCEGDAFTATTTPTASNEVTKGFEIETAVSSGSYTSPLPSTLSISDSGKRIRYFATNDCGTVYSNLVTLTVNPKPTVTSDLAFSAFCEGDAFTATTTPTANYEVTKGFEIETAVSSGSYTSPLPSTLSLSDSGKRIRYFATNGCGTVYSNLVTLTVNLDPTVTSDLAFSAFCEGDAFTATTTPTASNEVTKGFEIETAVGSGSYTSSLPSALSLSDSGKRIRYFATNGCGTVYSNLVTLTVNPKPTVTSDLAFSAFCEGDAFTATTTPTVSNEVTKGFEIETAVSSGSYTSPLPSTLSISDSGKRIRYFATNGCGTVYSNLVTLTVNQEPTVTSNLAFSAFCEGDAFTATTTPTINYEVTKGFEIETAVGSDSYTSPLPSTLSISDSGKRIRYFATNGCGTVYSNLVTLTVNPKPTVTSNLAFSAFCEGDAFTATTTPTANYELTKGFEIETAVGSGSYTSPLPSTLSSSDNGKRIRYFATNGCGTVYSNLVTLTVTANLVPSVSVHPGSSAVCAGTLITYTAVPVNGGTPSYKWFVNSSEQLGKNGSTFDYTPVSSSDVVLCEMTSGLTCVSTNPVTGKVSVTVTANETPVVSISANPSVTVCAGASVQYSASSVNGGTNPSYKWYVNNIQQGGTGSTFTYTPSNGDVIYCEMKSDLLCVTPSAIATSNPITASVNAIPTVSITPVSPLCIDAAIVTLSGNPAGGSFSGASGVSGTSFNPAVAGAGTHSIIYIYTDGYNCTNSDTIKIKVNDKPVVSINAVLPICVDAANVTLLGSGTPAGGTGTFSGAGVSGTIFNPSVAGVGTHLITYSYTDLNQCSNSATTNITVKDKLTAIISYDDSPYCKSDKKIQPVTFSGNAGGSFRVTSCSGSNSGPWAPSCNLSLNPLTGDIIPSLSDAGTYTVEYSISADGCIFISSASLEIIEVEFSQDKIEYEICKGESVTLTGEAITGAYIWEDSISNLLEIGVTSITVSPSSDASYWFIAYNGACSDKQEHSVTLKEQIKFLLPDDYSICPGMPAPLVAQFVEDQSGPYHATWWKRGVSDTVRTFITAHLETVDFPLENTFYIFETMHGDGLCPDIDSFRVFISDYPRIIEIEAIDKKIYEIIGVGSAPPFEYSIDDNTDFAYRSENTFKIARTGKHTAYIRDENGCESDSTFIVPVVDLIFPKYFMPNSMIARQTRWYIENIDYYPEIELIIFDRFGKELDRITNSLGWQGWDGKYLNKNMPSDDYWYLINIREIDFKQTGHFTLLRD